MKYLCLIYQDEAIPQRMSKAELQKIRGQYMAFTEEVKKSGQLVGNYGLQPGRVATTVRVRNGNMMITDGLFAETKEQLGGCFILEAKGIDEGTWIAARISSDQFGSVEVRPVREK